MKKLIILKCLLVATVLFYLAGCTSDPRPSAEALALDDRLTVAEARKAFEEEYIAAYNDCGHGHEHGHDCDHGHDHGHVVDHLGEFTPLWGKAVIRHEENGSFMTVPIMSDKRITVADLTRGIDNPRRVARVVRELFIAKEFESGKVLCYLKTTIPLRRDKLRRSGLPNERFHYLLEDYNIRNKVVTYTTLYGVTVNTELIENDIMSVRALRGEPLESYREKIERIHQALDGLFLITAKVRSFGSRSEFNFDVCMDCGRKIGLGSDHVCGKNEVSCIRCKEIMDNSALNGHVCQMQLCQKCGEEHSIYYEGCEEKKRDPDPFPLPGGGPLGGGGGHGGGGGGIGGGGGGGNGHVVGTANVTLNVNASGTVVLGTRYQVWIDVNLSSRYDEITYIEYTVEHNGKEWLIPSASGAFKFEFMAKIPGTHTFKAKVEISQGPSFTSNTHSVTHRFPNAQEIELKMMGYMKILWDASEKAATNSLTYEYATIFYIDTWKGSGSIEAMPEESKAYRYETEIMEAPFPTIDESFKRSSDPNEGGKWILGSFHTHPYWGKAPGTDPRVIGPSDVDKRSEHILLGCPAWLWDHYPPDGRGGEYGSVTPQSAAKISRYGKLFQYGGQGRQ